MFKSFFPMTAAGILLTASPLYAPFVAASNSDISQSERTYRKTAEGEGALTRKMIEDCIILKKTIDDSHVAIIEIQGQYETLGENSKEIGALLDEIKKQKNFDPGDRQELAAYNAKTEQYNTTLTERKKLVETIRERKEKYDQLTGKFDRECKAQPYYEDDYAAAVKKTGKSL
jgi:DNA repair ATPase RecN